MKRKFRLIAGATVLALLLSLSVSLVLSAEKEVPVRFFVIFGLLAVAAVASRLKLFWVRYLTLLVSLGYLGFYLAACPCATGSLEALFIGAGLGSWSAVGVPLLRLTVIAAFVYFLGNLFCGWVCFKGAVQEFLFREKLAVKVPPRLDRQLRRVRYLMLLLVAGYPLVFHSHFFSRFEPFKVVFNFSGTLAAVGLMIVILVASVFVYRPFCRYLCPLGALLGLVNRLGLFQLKIKSPDRCLDRGICVRSCPPGALTKKTGDAPEADPDLCLACGECRRCCPKNCLT